MTILGHTPTEHLGKPIAAGPPTLLSASVRGLLACVVERLYAEYGCCLRLTDVIDVVTGCVQDIQATPAEALPELAERLARHRLAEVGHHSGA